MTLKQYQYQESVALINT